MSTPTYGAALLWIAENDNDGDNEKPEELAGYISVALVADLFGKKPEDVADDVYRLRNGSLVASIYRPVLQALKARGYSDDEGREYINGGIRK